MRVTLWQPETAHVIWRRIRTLAASGSAQEALAALTNYFDSGGWFAPDRLLSERDLDSIRDHPSFASLLEIARVRRDDATSRTRPSITLIRPSATPPWPTLIALHGNEQTSADAAPHWVSASDLGWLVALPQSGTPVAPNSFVWAAATTGEIRRHFETLSTLCAGRSCVIAGYGRGGYHALRLAVSGAVAVSAAIVVSPSMNDIDELVDAMPAAGERGLHVAFVYGSEDETASRAVSKVSSQLRQAKVGVDLHVRTGMAHGFPDDFSQTLSRLLSALSSS
ncbi:MAG: hypothetical protein NVSMB57_03560 [Actinomycetota bacterium]